MWRKIAACALLLCAGCASYRDDCLLKDSFVGDIFSLFHKSAPPPEPTQGHP